MNSLVFEAPLMAALSEALGTLLRPGAVMLTTQLLPGEGWELIGDSDDCFEDVFDCAALVSLKRSLSAAAGLCLNFPTRWDASQTEPTVHIQRKR